MIYKTKDNKEIFYDDFELSTDNSFKINLPLTEDDYKSGNGEGIWCCCSKEDLEKINNNIKGVYLVKILNDSVYYPSLKYGTVVICGYNGDNRPVAIKDELDSKYESISIEEKLRITKMTLLCRNCPFPKCDEDCIVFCDYTNIMSRYKKK